MTRILADLPDEDVKWLDKLAAEQARPRAQLMRDAIAAYKAKASQDWIDAGSGYWAGRTRPARKNSSGDG